MTDCGCEKARQALEDYLHNELCGEDAAEIREHMENCTECTDEHRVGLVITDAVQRACDETAPEDLRDQVLLKLRSMQQH